MMFGSEYNIFEVNIFFTKLSNTFKKSAVKMKSFLNIVKT